MMTTAALGLCPRQPPSVLDGADPLEDVLPYAPHRLCSAGPWALLRGGDTHGRNLLDSYMQGNCSSSVGKSALLPLGVGPDRTSPTLDRAVTAAVSYLRCVGRAARRS